MVAVQREGGNSLDNDHGQQIAGDRGCSQVVLHKHHQVQEEVQHGPAGGLQEAALQQRQ